MKKVGLKLFSMIIGTCFILSGAPGYSQEGGEYEFTLEEITVTAQKREENQQKVPIAMETITSEQMQERALNNIDEVLSNISNVIINKSSDGMRVTLRGLADDSQLNMVDQHVSTPTVAINLDGAYNSNSNAGQNLFDVERVEVLFGPQSTMYASNSPGGIVNIVTAGPKTDKYEVSGLLEYGNYNLLHTEGAMNAPINDKVALRAAFSQSTHDGYISNGGDAEDSRSARLKALYQANDDLSIVLTGSYSITGGGGFASVETFEYQDEKDDPWTSDSSLGESNDQKTKSISADIDWELGFGSLSITPNWSSMTSSGRLTNTFMGETSTTDNEAENTQKGAEARLVSSADFFFKWILGANFYKSYDRRFTSYVDSTQTALSELNDKATAFYGNITYPVTDIFRATGGYRYSSDKTTTRNKEVDKPDAAQGLLNEDSTSVVEYSSPDYKIGVEYDMGSTSMLYVDRSTSYRMQGTGAERDGETAPPEKMTSYTVGMKNRFFENKLQLNASAYYYQYKNKVVSQMKADYFYESAELNGLYDFDMNSDGDYDDYVSLHDENSQSWGDLRSYGADIQVNWIATSRDKVDFSVSYLDSEWSELIFDYEYDDFYPMDDYSGRENTYSPNWTINLAYDHNFNLRNGGVLTARVDGRYQSEYILTWSEEDEPYNYQEPHYIANSSLVYANPDGKWTVSGYVKNLFNYAEKTSYMMSSLMIGSPRTYGAVLTVKY